MAIKFTFERVVGKAKWKDLKSTSCDPTPVSPQLDSVLKSRLLFTSHSFGLYTVASAKQNTFKINRFSDLWNLFIVKSIKTFDN